MLTYLVTAYQICIILWCFISGFVPRIPMISDNGDANSTDSIRFHYESSMSTHVHAGSSIHQLFLSNHTMCFWRCISISHPRSLMSTWWANTSGNSSSLYLSIQVLPFSSAHFFSSCIHLHIHLGLIFLDVAECRTLDLPRSHTRLFASTTWGLCKHGTPRASEWWQMCRGFFSQ